MRGFIVAIGGMLLVSVLASAAPGPTVELTSQGWNISADEQQATLTIGRENLGPILQEVRLNLRAANRPMPLKRWTVKKESDTRLIIKTAEPRSTWVFQLTPEALRISSTTADAVLTAEAPAPADRIVARLLDPQGVPVTWEGTDEVKNGYGGSETKNPSFLPRANPDVMYFALGQVSAANLHSLFDRKTDTAIDFPEQTAMQRHRKDSDLLDITVPVPGNAAIRVIPDYFTRKLGLPFYLPFDDTDFPRPPAVWSSWTSYYIEVKEDDIVRNADWIAANLKPYGFEYVELDGGYDGSGNIGTAVGTDHTWITNWDQAKFPHGPKWLTDYIKSKGLKAGIWIVPNAAAGQVQAHPEWYLHYKDGKIVRDYDTPALDSSNPQVMEFVKNEFKTLTDWGFEYFKFDGEHALPKYIPGVDLDRLYDKTTDPVTVYRNRLQAIRSVIGPEVFVEGCPAGTPLNGIGFFGSYFNGQDVYNNWQGMHNLFSSISGNAFLNHLVVYLMPGEGMELLPPMSVEEAGKHRHPAVVETLRERENPLTGFGTTLPEARTVVTYVSLAGVAYPMASVMSELPAERVALLQQTLPAMPIFPVDLFSRGTDAKYDMFKRMTADEYIHNYPEILDLKVNATSGVYDVVALTNWRSWPTTRQLAFGEKLGLDPDTSYLVFDFWNRKLLGVFKGQMDVSIDPHDTRVLLVHPLLSHPQFLGTSRHITGAYSMLGLGWDDERNRLRGSSETVARQPYSLWFHVPKDQHISRVRAATSVNSTVAVRQELQGELLSLTFEGQPEPVDWEVEFRAGAAQ